MFIAGYDSSNNLQFAKAQACGSGGGPIVVSPSGSIYIGGSFGGVNPFIVGNDSLPLVGTTNVFVPKLCYSNNGQGIPEITTNKEFILYPIPLMIS